MDYLNIFFKCTQNRTHNNNNNQKKKKKSHRDKIIIIFVYIFDEPPSFLDILIMHKLT